MVYQLKNTHSYHLNVFLAFIYIFIFFSFIFISWKAEIPYDNQIHLSVSKCYEYDTNNNMIELLDAGWNAENGVIVFVLFCSVI